METLVDSNVLIAFFNEKDALHERAFKACSEITGQIVVHEYILLETATILLQKSGKEIADQFIVVMLGNAAFRIFPSSESLFFTTINCFRIQKTKNLSFVDAALLSLSSYYNVLTYDEALAKAIKAQATSKNKKNDQRSGGI
jgi:predicted nucleic acid-binding protein